jgi:hypothetical protein
MFWSRPTPPIRATGLLDGAKERERGRKKKRRYVSFFLVGLLYYTEIL